MLSALSTRFSVSFLKTFAEHGACCVCKSDSRLLDDGEFCFSGLGWSACEHAAMSASYTAFERRIKQI